MEENESFLDKAKFYLDQRDTQYTEILLISNLGNRSKKNHVFVLTGFNIYVLTRKKISKKISKKYNRSIFDILAISITKPSTIEIHFAKSKNSNEFHLIFNTEKAQDAFNLVVDHIHRLLTPNEFKKVNIDFTSLTKPLTASTSHSILFRLNSQLKENDVELSNKFLTKVSHHVLSHFNSIILSKFKKMKQFFPIFFSCLFMDQYINQIDIYSPRRVFPLLFKQIECFENIVHVKIRGTDSQELQEFIEKSKNINSVSFYSCPNDKFEYLSSLIEKGKIDSVGFDSSINEESYQAFLELPSFNHLKYFRVTGLSDPKFISNFQKFTSLTVLSLASCNLMIGNVLDELISNQNLMLKKFDLSGNIGDGFRKFFTKSQKFDQMKRPKSLMPVKKSQRMNSVSIPNSRQAQNSDKTEVKVVLPSNLEVLHVNDVQWDVDQLIFFISLCSNSKLSNLSINNISFRTQNKTPQQDENNNTNEPNNKHQSRSNDNDDESDYYSDSEMSLSSNNSNSQQDINYKDFVYWDNLFSNIPQQMNFIRSLSWNSNKINNQFLSFLSKSPKLMAVSFCGCYCSDISFIEILLTSCKIQKANMKQIRFDNNLIYFRKFKNFLSHLPNMKSLKQLDLSHNSIDDECFEILTNSLLKADIEFISLDDSKATSFDVLMKIYSKLEQTRENPIKISYPMLDIQRLQIDHSNVVDLIECFDNLKKPLTKRKTDTHKYLPEVFFLRFENNFPQFMSKKGIVKEELNRSRSLAETKRINKKDNSNIEKINDNNNKNDDKNDDDTNDDIPKPKFINSNRSIPNLYGKKNVKMIPFNLNDSYSYSSDDEIPTYKKPIPKRSIQINQSKSNINKQNDINNNNNNNSSSTRSNYSSNDISIENSKNNNDSKRSRNFTVNTRSNASSPIHSYSNLNHRRTNSVSNVSRFGGAIITSNFNTSNTPKGNKNPSSSADFDDNDTNNTNSINYSFPINNDHNNDIDIYEDDHNDQTFMKKSRKKDFLEFSPNSDKRYWIKKDCSYNWKPSEIPNPPKIDNTLIFINYNKEFSLHNILNQMIKK